MIGTPSKLLSYGLALALSASSIHSARARTRVLYVGDDGLVIAGRSMDWNDDTHTNLWVFPRGMQRDGAAGPNSVKWTSKCSSRSTPIGKRWEARRSFPAPSGPPTASSAPTIWSP